jgi:hypothetical protein
MPLLGYIPEDAIKGMYICALRFDGYRYEQEVLHGDCGIALNRLAAKYRESLQFERDQNTNLAVFYITQRRLKEDEMIRDSPDHVLFDMLFLHLYQLDIPERFRNEEYCHKWREEYTEEQADIMAAMLRESFRSVPRIVTEPYE